MTARGAAVLAAAVAAAACALTLSGEIFWFLCLVCALSLCYGLISALWGIATLQIYMTAPLQQVPRGFKTKALLIARQKCPLPLSPFTFMARAGEKEEDFALDVSFLRETRTEVGLPTEHVGLSEASLTRAGAGDLFGLFSFKKRIDASAGTLVLPKPFDIEKLRIEKRDDGRALPGLAQEDVTSPEDVRAYRPGDAMKRVHWKLSTRGGDLMVRRYEVPAPPDTLLLVDCARIAGEQSRTLRDAVCETAVAIAKMQSADAVVRAPFYGAHPAEFVSGAGGSLERLSEELALQPFNADEPFDRVLSLSLRSLRRTGSTAIITSRLTPGIVEGAIHLRRMGPSVRFFYVSLTPESELAAPYVTRLQNHLVEVCYVTP